MFFWGFLKKIQLKHSFEAVDICWETLTQFTKWTILARSLLYRFLMRVEFSLQHLAANHCLSQTNWEQQNLCRNFIEEKEKRNLALEGSIMQILLSTQRHWRRSNEMLQGRLLDNSFREKAKTWVGSQHVTFLSLYLRHLPLLLLLTIISRLEKAELRLGSI